MGSRDPTSGDLPVKDVGMTISEAKERQIIASMSRAELEDRHLRLIEQHADIKKVFHKQENKMKQMATKLLRLVKDKKKEDEGSMVAPQDIDLQTRVEELNDDNKNLERQVAALKNKLMVAKQQLASAVPGKRMTAYDHVKPKVQTGIPSSKPNSARQQRIQNQMRVQSPQTPPKRPPSRDPVDPALPPNRYGHSLLEETRLEKRELEEAVSALQDQLREALETIENLEEEIREKELDHEQQIQQNKKEIAGAQRGTIQENVELIKLQRDVKDKVAKLQNLQGKYHNLEELLNKVKRSHEQVLEEMERMTSKLKDEKVQNENLRNELKSGTVSQQSIAEKEDQINDLRAEVELLKDAHEKLLHSTFDVEKDREFRAKERQYQIKIAQLEATIKVDVSEKNEVLDKLSSERDSSDEYQKKFRALQVEYFAMKEKYDDLQEKLKFFTSESAADFNEIQEALLLIKTRKQQACQELSFLEKVDDDKNKDFARANELLQAEHAETIQELEKTRGMLLLQHNINKDYQRDVEVTTRKMQEVKTECDEKLKEFAQLLDMRAERIKKLEAQLRDVAYGTKQHKLRADDADVDDVDDAEKELERGQNILEIHFGKATITRDGLQEIGSIESSTFISYEFFEFELQATQVVSGARPDYNYTSQYVVSVDDFLLHYLQREQMTVEFHQAFGTEYKTIGKGGIKFSELLEESHGRLHGTVSFVGFQSNLVVASAEYWVRLRVPMEQALRLYKERSKAIGYVTSNELGALDGTTGQRVQEDSSLNELNITILRCSQLKSKNEDVQPHPYCVYKFYDFADHDTKIVKNSNSPQFNDTRPYPVPMTEDLDAYLKNSMLEVYVFDDLETEHATYLGVAHVSLISLSQDKPLKGSFQLKRVDGSVSGSLEVIMQWQFTYLPASAKLTSRTQRRTGLSTSQVTPPVRATLKRTGESIADKRKPIATSGKLFEPKISAVESNEVMTTDRVQESERSPFDSTNGDQNLNDTFTKDFTDDHISNRTSETVDDKQLDAGSLAPKPPLRRQRTKPQNSIDQDDGDPRDMTLDHMKKLMNEPTSHEIVDSEDTDEAGFEPKSKPSLRSRRLKPQNSIDRDDGDPRGMTVDQMEKLMNEPTSHEIVDSEDTDEAGFEPKPKPKPAMRSKRPKPQNSIDQDDGDPRDMTLDQMEKLMNEPTSHEIVDSEDTDLESDDMALEQEMRRTVELSEPNTEPTTPAVAPQLKDMWPGNDTMFEEEGDDGSDEDDGVVMSPSTLRRQQTGSLSQSGDFSDIAEENEESPEATKQAGGEIDDEDDDEDDSDDGVVMSNVNTGRMSSTLTKAASSSPPIVVQITSLTLFDNSPLLSMDNIKQLFVSYKFLDADPEELETPVSLPVPLANRPISYNFKKVFRVDEENHEVTRRYLMHMLMDDHPSEGRIFFTVVSEPVDDEQNDCEDVAIAYVDLVQLLRDGADLLDVDIDLVDLFGSEEVTGALTVTVEALQALKNLYQ